MKSFNTKLALSALAVALLATPAFAQGQQHRQYQPSQLQDSWGNQVGGATGFATYPNPVVHSGSAMSREMGNDTIGGID